MCVLSSFEEYSDFLSIEIHCDCTARAAEELQKLMVIRNVSQTLVNWLMSCVKQDCVVAGKVQWESHSLLWRQLQRLFSLSIPVRFQHFKRSFTFCSIQKNTLVVIYYCCPGFVVLWHFIFSYFYSTKKWRKCYWLWCTPRVIFNQRVLKRVL